MQFVGGDPDFGSEAKLESVGEAGAGIPVDGGGIDTGEKAVGPVRIRGDYRIAVGRAVGVDVPDGSVETKV